MLLRARTLRTPGSGREGMEERSNVKRLIIVAAVFVTGCANFGDTGHKDGRQAGRYQMLSEAGTSGVYVLDTQQGAISLCHSETVNYITWCGKVAKVETGNGPPSYLLPGSKPTVSNW